MGRHLGQIYQKGERLICRDRCCDSPGYNTKYLSYTIMNQITSTIIGLSATQVTEALNCNDIEKMQFNKLLKDKKKKTIGIEQLISDQYIQTQKCMCETENKTNR